ncbi:MAG: putative glycosyltransferase [uncultured bacterium]|nr:MAG: putative glycosyltransferase [uncultured bacterium]
MTLSIVITTRNRYEDLIRCVKSLSLSSLPTQTELIIVDDFSSDKTRSISGATLKQFSIPGTIVHNREQYMMVKSRNEGAKKAKGELILFVDDDNIVDREMIKNLVGFANEHPKIGIIGPSMYYSNGEKYLDFQKINFYTGKTTGHVDNTRSHTCNSDGVPNVFLIKKSVFEKCGYFDEQLVQTFTEPDFALNAKKHGIGCVILKSAKTYHQTSKEDNFKPRSLGGMFRQKAYCLMRNRTVIVSRYGSLTQKAVYLIIFSWFWPVVYSLLVLKKLNFSLIKLYWLGFLDGITYLITGKLNWSFHE